MVIGLAFSTGISILAGTVWSVYMVTVGPNVIERLGRLAERRRSARRSLLVGTAGTVAT